MNSATAAVVFVAGWFGVLLLCCIYTCSGGRPMDIRDWFQGVWCGCFGCCGCCGSPVRSDEDANQYPFGGGTYPPIVVVHQPAEQQHEHRETSLQDVDDDSEGDTSPAPRAVLLSSSYPRMHGHSNKPSRNTTVVV